VLRARADAVSADALSAAVRVHADRVHDAVRRQGVEPGAAVAVVESSAMTLVDSAAARPAPVPELVGRWFALARRPGQRAGHDAYLPVGTGPLAEDGQQQLLAQGLERRSASARAALLLRDAYDLPAESVGAALDTGADEAQRLVGRARLALLPDVFDGEVPSASGHPSDEAGLARLAEGGPPTPLDAPTARHVHSCRTCRRVVEAQSDVRRLLAGLSVAALPDDAREALLERVSGRARAVLPAATAPVELVEELDEDDEPRRLLSPLWVVLSLLAACAAGLGLGVLTSREGPVERAQIGRLPAVTAPPLPTLEPRDPAARTQPRPSTTVFTLRPTTPAPAASASSDSATAQPSASSSAPSVALRPASGPAGDLVSVSGSGWEPDSAVSVAYLDALESQTGSGTEATVDGDGEFSVQISADDPEQPTGPHLVRVTDGTTTRTATYAAR